MVMRTIFFCCLTLLVLRPTSIISHFAGDTSADGHPDIGESTIPETSEGSSVNNEVEACDSPDVGDKTDAKIESNLFCTKRYEMDRMRQEQESEDDLPPWTSKNLLPIFLIPSLAGTRLRTWSRLNCGPGLTLSQFNVGGTVWLDLKRFLAQTKCWVNCMKLDPETQDDDECMTRPDEGIDAVTQVDETMPQGFLLKSLIQMLASKGYEPEQNMIAHPYDWRLPPSKMEDRDAAFSRLKLKIEETVRRYKKQNPGGSPVRGVLILGFSLGNLFIQYFFDHLRAELGVRGLERWTDEHIHGLIMGGSPFFGAVGPVKSIMTGETMGLPFSSEQSREMYLTFGGMPWMFPYAPKTPNPRHAAMNHGEVDHPTRAIEITMRNGTVLRPGNGDIVKERGIFGQLGDAKLDSVQRMIDKWYVRDHNIGGGNVLEPWTPPNGIDHIICLYGVNKPTPVGFKFREHPQNDHQYEETDVIINDRGDIHGKNGEHVLPKNRRFATRKSGDGTVPYYSLSWCHSWFGESAVNITRIPAHRKYEQDDIEEFQNVNVSNATQLREIERRPHGYNSFFTKWWAEDNPDTGLQREKSIQVWELDGILHRDTVTDKRVIHMLQALLSKREKTFRIYTSIYNRMIRQAREEIENSRLLEENWLAEIAKDGASLSSENIPTSDEDCYWDYANVECAWPRYCVYEYRFGDLHLSMSCRLRETPLDKDDPQLILHNHAVLNETLNVSNTIEWRIVYRDKERGMFAPWVHVFISFLCGGFVLGFIVFVFLRLHYDGLVQKVVSRTSSRGAEMNSETQGRLEESVMLLTDAVKELEGEINGSGDTTNAAASVGSPSDNLETTMSDTVEDLRHRVRRLSKISNERRLSEISEPSEH